jgi:hypothetical protein
MRKMNPIIVSIACVLSFACGQKEVETPSVAHEEAEALIANPIMILVGEEKKTHTPCQLRVISLSGDFSNKPQFTATVQAYFPNSTDHHDSNKKQAKVFAPIQVTENTVQTKTGSDLMSGQHKTKAHVITVFLPTGATSFDQAKSFQISAPHVGQGHHHKDHCLNLKLQ